MTRPRGVLLITCELGWGPLGSGLSPSFVGIMFSRWCNRLTTAHAYLKYRVAARRTIVTAGSHECETQAAFHLTNSG